MEILSISFAPNLDEMRHITTESFAGSQNVKVIQTIGLKGLYQIIAIIKIYAINYNESF
jgi:hypothetical protein